MLDILLDSLKAARDIKETKLVAFIEERSQSGSVQKLEHQVQLLEKKVAVQRVEIKEYKTTIQFEKEATLDAVDRVEKVALAATTTYSFVENTGQVVVDAHLFEEGLQAAKDYAALQFRKFIRVITDYQDKMELTLEEMLRINILIDGKVRTC